MNFTRRILSLVLAVFLTLALCTPVLAAELENGTITITNATVGKSYTAYKVFDASVNGEGAINYTYAGTLPQNDYFTADAAGNISATDAAKDANGYLTSGAIAFLSTLKGSAVKTIVAQSETVIFENLEFGYYYIETNNGTAVTVDSLNPNAVVYDKNQETSFDKKIIIGYEEDGTPILAEANTVNVGDEVEYQIKIDAANYNGANYITNYYVYDRMNSALTFNGNIKVTVNGTELSANDYSVEYDKTLSNKAYNFVINIPWVDQNGAFLYNKTNSTIIVTYSATVNENVLTNGPMENIAEYNFADLPTPPDGPKETTIDPDPDKPEKRTDSYSTEILVCKVDENGNALTGAKFSVGGESYSMSLLTQEVFEEVGVENGTHYMLKNGTYTTDDPILEDYQDGDVTVKANVNKYDSLDKKYAKVEHITKDSDVTKIVKECWVDEDGLLTIKGLGEGDYTITELVAPNGYNLLQSPIEVSITFDYDTEKFSASVSSIEESVVADENGVISFSVVNQPGTELPTTGGMGTTLLITVGCILFVATAIVLVSKKRLYNEG